MKANVKYDKNKTNEIYISGRKRAGRIIILLTEGKEEEKQGGPAGKVLDGSGVAEGAPMKKKEIVRTHEDLIEKPAFYEKYDLINRLK